MKNTKYLNNCYIYQIIMKKILQLFADLLLCSKYLYLTFLYSSDANDNGNNPTIVATPIIAICIEITFDTNLKY